jgi:heavy metal response regulator
MRILVVEDEPQIADFIDRGLCAEGYAVDVVADGVEAVEWVRAAAYDLLVLDVMLPGQDGFAVCRAVRKMGQRMPVLMLTARDAVADRVQGLDAGSDDYLVKPFAFAELLARVRALLRRGAVGGSGTLSMDGLVVDPASHEVRREGQQIVLTVKEFRLLEYLLSNRNQVLSRTMIAEHVWNYDFDNATNVIDVHIRNLRRKIDDPFDVKLIHTVRGAGYRMSERALV